MSTNANEHVLLALGSGCKGRDDVEISRGRGQSACFHRFIRVKPRETKCCTAFCKFILRCQLRVLVRLTRLCEV